MIYRLLFVRFCWSSRHQDSVGRLGIKDSVIILEEFASGVQVPREEAQEPLIMVAALVKWRSIAVRHVQGSISIELNLSHSFVSPHSTVLFLLFNLLPLTPF